MRNPHKKRMYPTLTAAAAAILATAAGAGVADYFGLGHTPLGGVVLDVTPAGGLLVSNIGSSGEDGVSIDLGQADGHAMKMYVPQSGTWPTGCMVSVVEGCPGPDTTLGMVMGAMPGGATSLSISTTGELAPACVHIELLNNGVVVDSREFSPPLPAVMATGTFGTDGTNPMTFVSNSGATGPALLLSMPADVTASITGSPVGPVPCDAAVVRLNGLPPGEPWIATMTVTGSNLPGNQLIIEQEALVGRHCCPTIDADTADDVAVTTNGGATMVGLSGPPLCAGCPECCDPPSADALIQSAGALISNIGSSGQDGATFGCPWYVTWFYSELHVSTSPISLDAPLQAMRLTATGTFSGSPDHSLGTCQVRNNAGTIEVLADFSAIGGSDVTVEVRDHGAPAGSVLLPGGPGVVLGNLMPATPLPLRLNGCGKLGTTPPCFVFDTEELFVFIGGGQAFIGDELRVLATSASGPISVVASLSLLGRNLAPFLAATPVIGADGTIYVVGGMDYSVSGGVTVAVGDLNGDGRDDLLVSNIGSSGQDGVAIDLGHSEGVRLGGDIDMGGFAEVTFDIYDDQCPMCPAGLVAGVGLETIAPDDTLLTARGSCCRGHVTLLKRTGEPAGSFTLSEDHSLTISTTPGSSLHVTDLGAAVRLNGLPPGEPVIGTLCTVQQDPPGPDGPDVTVSAPGQGPFTEVAHIVISHAEVALAVSGINRATIKAEASPACNPCSFALTRSGVVMHGLVHDALGEARLIAQDCDDADDDLSPLWVANIGSSGQDGVSIDLRSHLCSDVDQDDDGLPDNTVTGIHGNTISDPDVYDEPLTAMHWTSEVTVGGAADTVDLGLVPGPVPGFKWLTESGFHHWRGSTTGTIRVTARDEFGNLVGEVSGLNPGLVGTVLSSVLPDEFQVEWGLGQGAAAGSTTVSFVYHKITWQALVPVQLLPGVTVSAKSIEVLEEPTSGGPVALDFTLDGLEITMSPPGGVTASFALLGETVLTSSPPCPGDCASPADGNVDVIDFLALLGQWGTTGGCDIMAPAGVDVVDFLALLGAWGICP